MATKTITVTIQNIEKVNVAEPEQPDKWDYRCAFILDDSGFSLSSQISFSANATADDIWETLRLEAQKFAERDHWFDALLPLEGTDQQFQFDVGG